MNPRLFEIEHSEISKWFSQLQFDICTELEKHESNVEFSTDKWQRTEGGGGVSKVLSNGNTFEKAAVLFSEIYGDTPDFLKQNNQHSILKNIDEKSEFYATGLSIVLHPNNPWVPIIHMNTRFFAANNTAWFGGGIDLTPIYVVDSEAKQFHTHLKTCCDTFNNQYYNDFKLWADDYFYIQHRNETRGVGGIFFDRLAPANSDEAEHFFNFVKEVGKTFLKAYLPIVVENKNKDFNTQQKEFQLIRRSRYAEFNLVYDKGTQFGLQSAGRIESILASLPPMAAWQYNYMPAKNSLEEITLNKLKKNIQWI
jgi:coproporphyrinogen III oxidase